MPAPRKRPGDVTGRTAEALAVQHSEELQKRAQEIALMTTATRVAKEEIVDATAPGGNADLSVEAAAEPNVGPVPVKTDEIVDLSPDAVSSHGIEPVAVVEVAPAYRVIRVNSDIKNMTLGHGNHYTFEEGQRYRVPAFVADHLESKGLVWH